MKKILILFLAAALLLPVFAVAEIAVDPSADRGINPQRDLPNNPAIPGESMTTGLPTDLPYIPILVNIDNVAGAWPQWGIAEADIIYEMPIHGLSLTRLMALFAYHHPTSAGPVRSGRVMHAEMREEWDAGWAFVGVQTKAGTNVNDVIRELGLRKKSAPLLMNRLHMGDVSHHKGPHNHSINLQKAAATIADYDFPQRPFLFTDVLPESGDPATSIRLLYGGGNEKSYTNSSYAYDTATNLYTRFRNKKPYVDMKAADPKASLTFSNVIVQWTDLKFNGAASAPILTEVGEGNADIFTGGRHIAGYWVRKDLQSRTIFYDQDGNEIQLQRGKTWINITSERSTKVVYE
jgi:hypothetical protein